MPDWDLEARYAYEAGASAMLLEVVCCLPAPELVAVRQWIEDLRAWAGGPPPVAPHLWPLASDNGG